MPKRKKRPWLDASQAERARERDSEKARERRERQRAFREKFPERFVAEIEDGDVQGALESTRGTVRALGDDAHVARASTSGRGGRVRALGDDSIAARAEGRRSRGVAFGRRADEDESTSTDPRSFPKHEPYQTRDGISDAEFERRRSHVEAVTRDIGTCARHKQLRRACKAFVDLIARDGMVPTPYTYASLLNAYVNTGDMRGAEALMERMSEVGCAPNVVAFTTMLKGYLLVADVETAWKLLDGMRHPVAPDIRAVNTFVRVCVRCGDLRMARKAYERMRGWDVVPDETTNRLFGRLLAQGLKCDELKSLIKVVKKNEHLRWTRDPSSGHCQFWRAGACERGVNCRFYHDPSIEQNDAREREIERNDTMAHLFVNHAHATAMIGDVKRSKKSLKKAAKYLAVVDDDVNVGGLKCRDERAELFRQTSRDELKLEMQRIKAFVERVERGEQKLPKLDEHLARTLIFSSRILRPESFPERGSRASTEETNALRKSLFTALKDTMGLADDSERVERAIRKVISDDGTICFNRMFSHETTMATRELNLEVAAGNGDWALAQAKSDGSADWISLELRHDRVYKIFSRAVLSGTRNFSAMGGDAAYVMRRYIAPGSVSNVFVNFPEPPHHSGDDAADNSLALLSEDFFRDVHLSLRSEGGCLVIFSDNHRYMQSLARALAGMGLFSNREANLASGELCVRFETIQGVRLYEGIPGRLTGHRVYEQSYFDRFWENGRHVDRYFLSLERV